MQHLRHILGKYRRFAGPLLVAVTIAVFTYFIIHSPQLRHALIHTNPVVLLVVALGYLLFISCLAWVNDITLQLCGYRLDGRESLLLTCYSTIANFFGPLQSGPGVRAAYLKQKHNVRLRDYTVATFMYYALYAIVSAFFLLAGSGTYWPFALVGAICVAGGSLFIVQFMRRRMAKKSGQAMLQLEPRIIAKLALATVLQLGSMVFIYGVELHAVGHHMTFPELVAYAGAANFSLFVSLTPGGIGFREAFLTFSQHIHHVSTTTIIAAGIIDRSVYVVLLGIIFLIILGMHANKRFKNLNPAPQIN